MTTRVFIMCQGQQSRLAALPIPKHLLPLPLSGQTILGRTIGMLLLDRARPTQGNELVVVGTKRHAEAFTTLVYDRAFHLGEWHEDKHVNQARCGARTWARGTVNVLELDQPGNSILKGMAQLRTAFLDPTYDRTVILLGDVVYSRRCLNALVDKIAEPPIWFAVSPDLSPSQGEVFGCSFDREGRETFVELLDNVRHPPFKEYQCGQLRELVWDWQQRGTETGDRYPVLRERPSPSFCTILDRDYTKDVDTMKDLERLGELDVAAWRDDNPESAHPW